jgi:hypothetical protein
MMARLARTILVPPLDAIFRSWGRRNAKSYDVRNTIIIAGVGRGGSTWLAELFATLPGYPLLWEPLHLGSNPECIKYGFDWQTYISAGQDEPLKQRYLHQVLTGANLSCELLTSLHFHPIQFLRFRGYLVKFVNANLLLDWMLHLFPVRAILLIRHPCAVVASQLRHSAWDHVNKEKMTFSQNLAHDYPHLVEIHKSIRDREEVLAFEWALQTFIPLNRPKPYPWYLTTYERLVEDGHKELSCLFQFLGEPVPGEAYKHLRVPSATTQDGSNIANGRNPLSGWQEQLTAHQIQMILNVVHRVGIDFYGDAATPDYRRLSGYTMTNG